MRKFSLGFLAIFLLTACDSLGIPNIFAHDQVPPQVKEEPILVDATTLPGENASWPRLGDVPFMPKDFSPKPVYNHYMNELEFDRNEADVAKKEAAGDTLTGSGALVPPQLPTQK